MKYTIKNFIKDFPDDKTCLAFIFKNRYPNGQLVTKGYLPKIFTLGPKVI